MVKYTKEFDEAKKFDSDEEAVHLLKCLIANKAMTKQEAGNMNFVDILASFKGGKEMLNMVSDKPPKEKPQKCLVFLAHYLEKSYLDVIVHDKIEPEVLPKFIKLYADRGYNISKDSVIVLPSQYYRKIIPNKCNEFDDIPEETIAAAGAYAEANHFEFPEQLNMFYISFPKYNMLSFAIPVK